MKRLEERDILSIKAGNNAALSRIYSFHYKHCISKVQSIAKASREDAEDLVMDAILVLRENIVADKFVNENVSAYLVTVAINKWRNKSKRDRRIEKFDPVVMEQVLSEKLTHSSSEMLPRLKAIYKTIDRLKGGCHDLLKRNLVDGIPLKNLVAELNFSSYDVIKTTKSRCMKKFKLLLNEIISE